MAQLEGRTLLDVGCGLGEFCTWLESQNLYVDYAGIDIVPTMIAMASGRFPQKKFKVASLADCAADIPEKEIVIASGIFAKRTSNPEVFLRGMITAMFDKATVAVAFNSLSAWAVEKEAGEFYADPLETLAFCKTLTPWVTLRHDYHPRDFSIYMYRDRNA